ncbi:Rieske 2Fe-2S domain-containing protein [Nocardia sp. NPDC051787]|uniref:Rieske 2Fe-2S domain-containing protein n=1 Tax=Nocardia sp. NPDC051787 TaxID=3155415 RepID=UPI00343DE159
MSRTAAGSRRPDKANPLADREPRDTPPPYPSGWYGVAFCTELQPGTVLRRRLMDRDIVVFRTRSATASAAEAYCPHLGAHLGDGSVQGEELRCPFHGFTFATDGHCTSSPYGAPPPAARLGLLELREVSGLVMVWHGAPGETPWEIDTPPGNPGWRPMRFKRPKVFSHPQEVVENGVDIGHLSVLHRFGRVRVIEPLTLDGPHLRITVGFARPTPLIGDIDTEISVHISGLGFSLVETTAAGGWSMRQLVACTPIGERELIAHVGSALCSRGKTRLGRALWWPVEALLERIVFRIVVAEFDRDIPIWNRKKYLQRPAIAAGDGPIAKYRAWAQQFYPQHRAQSARRAPQIGCLEE